MYGAGDGTRTRDILLGKQTLYQLSYTRNSLNRNAPAVTCQESFKWRGTQRAMRPALRGVRKRQGRWLILAVGLMFRRAGIGVAFAAIDQVRVVVTCPARHIVRARPTGVCHANVAAA